MGNEFWADYYIARDSGGEFGYSNMLIVTPDVPPGGGAYLTGLQGLQLQRLPRLTITMTTTNTIVLSWPTQPTAYAVQQNPNLSPMNWMTLSNPPVTVVQEQQVVLPAPPTGRMFYRLVSQ